MRIEDKNPIKINQMHVGGQGLIVKIHPGEKSYRQRLMAMGLLPGTQFVVSRVAPLGDPIELNVRGYNLILRKDEATILEVKQVKSTNS